MTKAAISIRKLRDYPTEVTLRRLTANGWNTIKEFSPTAEWIEDMRQYLFYSPRWAIDHWIWMTDDCIAVQYNLAGGNTND